jgi:hypothetical protein
LVNYWNGYFLFVFIFNFCRCVCWDQATVSEANDVFDVGFYGAYNFCLSRLDFNLHNPSANIRCCDIIRINSGYVFCNSETCHRGSGRNWADIFSPLIDSLDAILYPISVAFGVVLRSFCVRILATIRFIRIGFWQIPENFRNSLFVVDVYEPARLIPAYKNILTITEDIVCRIDYRHFRPFSYGRDEDPETEVSIGTLKKRKRALLCIFALLFIPAQLYRFSIKSTCWLYLPLVYIAYKKEHQNGSYDYRLDFLERRWEWWRRIVALGTLLGFATTTAVYNFSLVPDLLRYRAISLFEYLYLLKFPNLKSWQILNLMSALITIYLFSQIGNTKILHRHLHSKKHLSMVGGRIDQFEMLTRARNVSTAVLVFILFLHALILFSPIKANLPDVIARAAKGIYGEYMP